VSIVLQTLAMMIWAPRPHAFPDLLPTEPVAIGGALLAPKQILVLLVSATMMAGLLLLVNRTRLGAGDARHRRESPHRRPDGRRRQCGDRDDLRDRRGAGGGRRRAVRRSTTTRPSS
jgi:hypothetical protein